MKAHGYTSCEQIHDFDVIISRNWPRFDSFLPRDIVWVNSEKNRFVITTNLQKTVGLDGGYRALMVTTLNKPV